MSVSERAGATSQFDYVTVGHVTVDVLRDGSRRPGGSAFYSALQAARLGRRAAILTRGVPAQIERALAPYRGELELFIEEAAETTTFATAGAGQRRSQRVLAWAGPIAERADVRAAVLHLAPVARELSGSWLQRRPAHVGFLGLTPQGLVRQWSTRSGDPFALAAPASVPAIAASCDALVVSEHERASCEGMIDAAVRAGASVAITAGPRPTRMIARGDTVELAPGEVPVAVDDLGAGDVFAAALFIALSEGRPPARAAAYANAAAAMRVLGEGAQAIADARAIEAHIAAR